MSARALCALAAIILFAFSAHAWTDSAQHDMQNMSGMSMKSKRKTRGKSGRRAQRRGRARKRGGTRAMDMRARKMPSSTLSSTQAKATSKQTGMNMSGMQNNAQTPKAQPALSQEQMNMPGMMTPSNASTPKPSASPQMEMNMPGMQSQQTQASPNPNQRPVQENSGMDNMMGMNMNAEANKEKASAMKNMNSMPGMEAGEMSNMPMGANSLLLMEDDQMKICIGPGAKNTLPMGQMGSGSSWQPTTSPMYMYSKMVGNWTVFVHADAKVGVNSQGGPRGFTRFESQNWIMPMAFHRMGPGTLELRGMFSLEPLTLAPGGSPQLFQTGETYKRQPLIDRQHPHDLFMELSGTYTVALGEKGTWFTYLGFPGEPSIGPTAFMHRPSASENPSAPLAHHLEDSTHIAFGVFSTGFTYRGLKLEGSLFNAREPDENRYNFEFHTWNSRSVRLSFAPNSNWSMQVSHGFLKHPEATEAADIRRTTASVSYNKPFKDGNWASTLIWGRNHVSRTGAVANLNGYTAESTLNFLRRNYIYTRLELADKNELLRQEDRARLGINEEHPSFRIGAYTFGGARDIWNTKHLSIALGADVTFYSKPAVLDSVYGNRPTSYHFFLRIRPSGMSMTGRYTGKNSGANDTEALTTQP
ncbi:MAG: hypothetical protein DMF68_08255 [Acidobacteria bacterium]|nr:MAG: hypothetical protein DMF68_08255 [Acidobacteriota bacterium]